jgi:hypothetical protein
VSHSDDPGFVDTKKKNPMLVGNASNCRTYLEFPKQHLKQAKNYTFKKNIEGNAEEDIIRNDSYIQGYSK